MNRKLIVRVAQGVAAMILMAAGVMKFMRAPGSVVVFELLDMEPAGRYLVAVIEIAAAMLLLSPFAALGSLIAVAVMCGAIIAHATQLGFVVNDDGGRLVGMLVMALMSSGFVLVTRRKELPLLGKNL